MLVRPWATADYFFSVNGGVETLPSGSRCCSARVAVQNFVESVPGELGSGRMMSTPGYRLAVHVGITRADRLVDRMKEHKRAAEPDRWPATPGAYFVRHRGWGAIERLELVPDRIAAWLTKAEWTCALAARGVEVFGQNPGDLCPGKGWRDARGEWGVNWQNPRTWTLCVDAAGRVTTALV